VRAHWPTSDIRVALYNAGFGIWKPFLQITEDEVDKVTDANVKAAFAFAHEAITAFQGQAIDENEELALANAARSSSLAPPPLCAAIPPRRHFRPASLRFARFRKV